MKKLFGFLLLASLMFSGVANAAYYRVDFSGTFFDINGIFEDGTYEGFFTYDADLATSPGTIILDVFNLEPPISKLGFEKDLEFNFAFSGGTGSFDESNAGLGRLVFENGTLTDWVIGGDEAGIRGIRNRGPLDFFIQSEYTEAINFPELDYFMGPAPIWEQTYVSAVPVPAAIWAFGAGLVALFGLQRRRKARAEAVPA